MAVCQVIAQLRQKNFGRGDEIVCFTDALAQQAQKDQAYCSGQISSEVFCESVCTPENCRASIFPILNARARLKPNGEVYATWTKDS